MYKVFLAGGIASGKSTVARILESLGASRIDLDQSPAACFRREVPAQMPSVANLERILQILFRAS